MKINAKQAIAENWTLTIRGWCSALEIGKNQQQMLEQYHREYTDSVFLSRLGRALNPSAKKPVWILNYDEFKTLQEYRAKRASNGAGRPHKKK